MQSWREVHVPALNLDGKDLFVYDSMTQELMSPIVNDEAKLYVESLPTTQRTWVTLLPM